MIPLLALICSALLVVHAAALKRDEVNQTDIWWSPVVETTNGRVQGYVLEHVNQSVKSQLALYSR